MLDLMPKQLVQKKQQCLLKVVASVLGAAMIGAICGSVLASFGSAISGSSAAVATTMILAGMIGALVGKVPGALFGIVLGSLLVGFGSAIGGSVFGVTLTIFVCAMIAGWIQWHLESETNRQDREAMTQSSK